MLGLRGFDSICFDLKIRRDLVARVWYIGSCQVGVEVGREVGKVLGSV